MKKKHIKNLARVGIPANVAAKWEEKSAELKMDEEPGEILVYGPFIDDLTSEFFGLEDLAVSSISFREKLKAIKGNVLLRINSPGGDVWEADAVMNAIIERRNDGDEVNMVVDGLAASAASLVMMRGNQVRAGKMSSIMIHECSCFEYGNKRDLRHAADMLEGIDGQAIELYKARLKKDEDEIMSLLEAETWYTADEALESGLIDEIVELEDRKKGASSKLDDPDFEEQKKSFFEERQLRLAALAA